MEQQQWQIGSPQTLELDDVRSIKAGIIAGRVDILVHDEPVTRIEVSEVHGEPIDLTLNDGVLELVHTPGSARGGWLGFTGQIVTGRTKEAAVISIAVPEGTAVALRTVSGDGLACGTRETTLDTVSGSIMADDTTGTLRVSTVSGEAIVRHHSGHLVAKTVSGEVTASGYCESIRTNSVSGGITLDLLGDPGDLVAKTVSGDLTVRLSGEVGVDVSATSVSGSLTVNDQKFTARGNHTHREAGSTGSVLTVRASSVSGDIAIFHHRPDYLAGNGSVEVQDGGL
ncbi:hypothetical protein BJ994_001940 [Arthrobacter pigmenti]|uniref:DUF4097 domain-containing protein n=1 Tax=Arthrobacter pigmenti TaxID=271432 RepID=A0A846RR30_9MICC|nr:DUF4097 family beta strand repeat-containing protein [Arthrobacter pigmenti]NJC22864.1 hypothetical protein [Arthrobacter pigmenti]